jgi:hypothetical protein
MLHKDTGHESYFKFYTKFQYSPIDFANHGISLQVDESIYLSAS